MIDVRPRRATNGRVARWAAGFFILLGAAAPAGGQGVSYSVVVKSGDTAPNTGGLTFGAPAGGQTFVSPTVSGGGTVLLYGAVTGAGVTPGVNDFGIWTSAAGSVQYVARAGDAAPGTGGATYLNIPPASTSDFAAIGAGGTVAFRGSLVQTGAVTAANDQGIWSGTAGNVQLLAREGDAAPGTGGAVFNTLTSPAVRANGSVLFSATLVQGGAVTAANDGGFWAGTPGNVQLFVREGDTALGTGGATFASLQFGSANASGVAGFRGSLVQGGSVNSSNAGGVWAGTAGNLQLIYRLGDTIAPVGGPVTGTGLPAVLADGRTLVSATFQQNGTTITAANDVAAFIGTSAADRQLAFRKGDAIPNAPAGVVLGSIGIPRAAGNAVTFFTVVAGTGVTTANDRAIFTWSPAGGLSLAAREGDDAPGAGGARFGQIGAVTPLGGALPALGPDGKTLAFYAPLTGTGVTTANDAGIWINDGTGLRLVARKGDQLDLDPGAGTDLVTISNLGLYDDLRGLQAGFNPIADDGSLVWLATFTDGRNAVLVSPAPVPEPAAVLGIAAGGLALGGWLRRRVRR